MFPTTFFFKYNKIKEKIINWVSKIANELNVIGLMNAQLALKDSELYVLRS